MWLNYLLTEKWISKQRLMVITCIDSFIYIFPSIIAPRHSVNVNTDCYFSGLWNIKQKIRYVISYIPSWQRFEVYLGWILILQNLQLHDILFKIRRNRNIIRKAEIYTLYSWASKNLFVLSLSPQGILTAKKKLELDVGIGIGKI